MVVAVAGDSPVTHVSRAPATACACRRSTRELTRRYFADQGIDADVRLCYGASEAKVPDIADCVVEITETGRALRAAGLRIIDTILTSYTEVIANQAVVRRPRQAPRDGPADDAAQRRPRGADKVLLKLNVAAERLRRGARRAAVGQVAHGVEARRRRVRRRERGRQAHDQPDHPGAVATPGRPTCSRSRSPRSCPMTTAWSSAFDAAVGLGIGRRRPTARRTCSTASRSPTGRAHRRRHRGELRAAAQARSRSRRRRLRPPDDARWRARSSAVIAGARRGRGGQLRRRRPRRRPPRARRARSGRCSRRPTSSCRGGGSCAATAGWSPVTRAARPRCCAPRAWWCATAAWSRAPHGRFAVTPDPTPRRCNATRSPQSGRDRHWTIRAWTRESRWSADPMRRARSLESAGAISPCGAVWRTLALDLDERHADVGRGRRAAWPRPGRAGRRARRRGSRRRRWPARPRAGRAARPTGGSRPARRAPSRGW